MTGPDFMAEAVRLAAEGVREGVGGPFGAVVVKDGAIIGASCNRVLAANDPTAHAEVEAIRRACEWLGTFSLAGCTMYATCEPCPMCMGAIHWARLDEVVFAMTRHDAADIGFDDLAIAEWMTSPAMPMRRVARADAAAVFVDWANRPDRPRY